MAMAYHMGPWLLTLMVVFALVPHGDMNELRRNLEAACGNLIDAFDKITSSQSGSAAPLTMTSHSNLTSMARGNGIPDPQPPQGRRMQPLQPTPPYSAPQTQSTRSNIHEVRNCTLLLK